MRNAILKAEIEKVFALLRASSLEPVVIKGWASARLYACPDLRSYGDIDLLFRPSQLAAARALLGGRKDVDLDHFEFAALPEAAIGDIFDRSRLVSLGGSSIRVLGPEDHLSLLCRHFGRHLGAYPVGLCDVAAALESIPADFDWNRCLGPSSHEAHWIQCTLSLARELLDARVDQPIRIPRWFVSGTLEHWAIKQSPIGPIRGSSKHLLAALIERWPSPLKATLMLGRRVDNRPRLPYQVFWFARLMSRFARRSLIRSRTGRHLPVRLG